MTLVAVAVPETESQLAVMLCVLEGEGIDAFVQGYYFGALKPGPRIGSYNARRILVSEDDRDAARASLAILQPPLPDRTRWTDKLRIVIETLLLFGWFVPGTRRKRARSADDATSESPHIEGTSHE